MKDVLKIFTVSKGYEGLYAVSNNGRIKRLYNVNNHKKHILGEQLNSQGYATCRLYKKGTNILGIVFRVHRLVALAFIPNPNKKPFINHINSIRNDNCIINIEWCTHKENMVHSFKMGRNFARKGEEANKAKLTMAQVRSIRAILLKGDKQENIAKKFNVDQTTISLIGSNKTYYDPNFTPIKSDYGKGNRKLSYKQINEIRNGTWISQNQIANKFKISQCHVSDIINLKKRIAS